MIYLDLAGLVSSTAGEIFAAIDEAPPEIQVTEVRLDLPAVLEYIPGRRQLRVRPPSTYPARRSRRPGRVLLVLTPEDPERGARA